ncbi:MAG TPA: hypothetical protein VGQ98_03595 [Gemmatimonadaceae bacterium]|nr:hypothetical protein [Gemmatimonadaceae bacterium]
MKRVVLCLTATVLLAACENSTDPLGGFLGGGGALTQTQATGNWSFTVQRTTTFPACTNPLANGSAITAHLDVAGDGTLATTSTWLNPISVVVQPLSGSVDLTNGASTLHFAAPAVSGTAQMEILGTMRASGGLTGTLRDPEPGFSQVFGTGGCEYSLSGIKTS